jgi:hypothetical protein
MYRVASSNPFAISNHSLEIVPLSQVTLYIQPYSRKPGDGRFEGPNNR